MPRHPHKQKQLDDALFEAITIQDWQALCHALKTGANANATHPVTGDPAIICAITTIYEDKLAARFVGLLLKHHASPNAKSAEDGMPALHISTLHEKPRTAHALIHCGGVPADIHAVHPGLGTALELAKSSYERLPSATPGDAYRVLQVLQKAEDFHKRKISLLDEFDQLATRHQRFIRKIDLANAVTPPLNVWRPVIRA